MSLDVETAIFLFKHPPAYWMVLGSSGQASSPTGAGEAQGSGGACFLLPGDSQKGQTVGAG